MRIILDLVRHASGLMGTDSATAAREDGEGPKAPKLLPGPFCQGPFPGLSP
jgi:hypothetical protein